MQTALLDERIQTSYGELLFDWQEGNEFIGDLDTVFEDQVNGLVGAADAGGVYLSLACRHGAHVRLVLHDAEPLLPPEQFKDVVEVS